MSIFTRAFWKAALERMLWTIAQAGIASIGVGVGFQDINWIAIASVAGVAAVLSLLKSILVNVATDGGGPAITDAEVLNQAPVEVK